MAHDHSRNKDVVVQDYKLYNQHACYNGHEEMLVFGLHGRVGMVTIKSKEPIKSLNCENSVEIEIKQTKEDMEEKKLKLKPFDLQKAREGKPVCTRDGRKARIICFDAKCADTPIVALVSRKNEEEYLFRYYRNGKFRNDEDSGADLMMLPEKKEGWAVIRRSDIYKTEEQAKEVLLNSRVGVMIRKIEWEV